MTGVSSFVVTEYQLLGAALPGLVTLIVGALLRWLFVALRGRAIGVDAARLVRWAAQTIPDTSQRYVEVAALLSKRWPVLSGEQIEVLIESEVHAVKLALAAAAPGPPGSPGGPVVPDPGAPSASIPGSATSTATLSVVPVATAPVG